MSYAKSFGAAAVLGAGGTMGRGVAANAAAAGIPVRAWNRTAGKLDATLAAMGAVAASCTPGAVWVQMGTIGLDGTERCAALCFGREDSARAPGRRLFPIRAQA